MTIATSTLTTILACSLVFLIICFLVWVLACFLTILLPVVLEMCIDERQLSLQSPWSASGSLLSKDVTEDPLGCTCWLWSITYASIRAVVDEDNIYHGAYIAWSTQKRE